MKTKDKAEVAPAQAGEKHNAYKASDEEIFSLMSERCYQLEKQVEALTKALKHLIECPDYRNIQTHEMTYAKVILKQFGTNWEEGK